MKKRIKIQRDELGFTLPEVLVTIMILIVVLFSLYGIFDMSIRVFAFGNDKVEAVENARIGLDKMAREIRGAYPVDVVNNQKYLFFSASGAPSSPPAVPSTATQITFGNERGASGDGKITCPDAATCEYITYKLASASDPVAACSVAPCTLVRNATSIGSNPASGGQPVVEFVELDGLTFEYLKSNGSPATGDQSEIARVRITLEIRVEGGQQDGTQTLTTDVELRNQVASNEPADSDGDGIPDASDACPSEVGLPEFSGCTTMPSDTTPPNTTIDIGPSGTVTSTTADFEFSSNETGSTFECSLDGAGYSACSSQTQYTGLSESSHTLQVRAVDAAGNVDESPASRTWTVASTPPPGAVNDGSAASRIEIKRTGPQQNNPLTINVLNNDAPNASSLTIASVTQPSVGTRVTISADRKSVIYTAQGGGADKNPFTFTYTIKDSQDRTDTATVFIEVKN